MNAKNTGSITPVDVAEQAVAEGLVIPGQNTEVKIPVDVVEEKIVKVSVEDGKKTLGQHVDSAVAKVKEHKKIVLVAGATVATGVVTYLRYTKKQVELSIVEEPQERENLDETAV